MAFNPLFPYRPLHTSAAAFLTTVFFADVSAAWHLLRGRDNSAIRKTLSMVMWTAPITASVQALIGDAYGLNTLEHQPAKITMMEGHQDNSSGEPTPLILSGWPDMRHEETCSKVEIPALGNLILKRSLTESIPMLKDLPSEDRPDSVAMFWSLRVTTGLGMLVILVGAWSLWLR